MVRRRNPFQDQINGSDRYSEATPAEYVDVLVKRDCT